MGHVVDLRMLLSVPAVISVNMVIVMGGVLVRILLANVMRLKLVVVIVLHTTVNAVHVNEI